MRADREVRYCITVQYVDEKGDNQIHTTAIQSQKFGIGEKTSKSEVGIIIVFDYVLIISDEKLKKSEYFLMDQQLL